MIKKAKKKPIVIEFIQYNGNTNKKDIEDWIGKDLRCEVFSDSAYEAGMGMPYFSLFIPTLEGEMRADPHDYIIKGVRGEFYPCKPDVFEKTYDVIEEENEELKQKCEGRRVNKMSDKVISLEKLGKRGTIKVYTQAFVERLEKENAELKEKLGDVQMQKAGEKSDLVWKLKTANEQKADQLTKAKELIKKLYSHVFQGMGFMEINDYNVQKAEAEQFLKE